MNGPAGTFTNSMTWSPAGRGITAEVTPASVRSKTAAVPGAVSTRDTATWSVSRSAASAAAVAAVSRSLASSSWASIRCSSASSTSWSNSAVSATLAGGSRTGFEHGRFDDLRVIIVERLGERHDREHTRERRFAGRLLSSERLVGYGPSQFVVLAKQRRRHSGVGLPVLRAELDYGVELPSQPIGLALHVQRLLAICRHAHAKIPRGSGSDE